MCPPRLCFETEVNSHMLHLSNSFMCRTLGCAFLSCITSSFLDVHFLSHLKQGTTGLLLWMSLKCFLIKNLLWFVKKQFGHFIFLVFILEWYSMCWARLLLSARGFLQIGHGCFSFGWWLLLWRLSVALSWDCQGHILQESFGLSWGLLCFALICCPREFFVLNVLGHISHENIFPSWVVFLWW